MANIVTLPGANATPLPQQPTAPPEVKRRPVTQTSNRFSNRPAGKLELVAVAPPAGRVLLHRKFRCWAPGLVFLTLSVAGQCADIQIRNPLRESGFAFVVEGDGIVFRNGTDRPVTSVCVVWHLSGGALDASRMTHTIHQVRENWDELRHPIVLPGGTLAFTLAENPDLAESARAAAHALVTLDTVIVENRILGPHQCPAASDLEAKRKAKREISRRFLARQGSAQDRIEWLRAEQARAGNAYGRTLLEDLLYRMEKWGMANAEQMARRNDVTSPALKEESR
jgi:hypothetical protein